MKYETQTLSQRPDGRAVGSDRAFVAPSQRRHGLAGPARSTCARSSTRCSTMPAKGVPGGPAPRLAPLEDRLQLLPSGGTGTAPGRRSSTSFARWPASRPGGRRRPALPPSTASRSRPPRVARRRGTDGGKKVKGRKRHILVDSLGFLIAVVVTAANVDDARAAQDVFAQVTRPGLPAAAGGLRR